MSEIDNPFDGEACRLMRAQGATEQQARDYVVLRYLRSGDTRALAHWLMGDYSPGPAVKKMVSYMLQPTRQDPEDAGKILTCDPHIIPYELVIKSRGGKKGRRSDRVAAERNQAIRDLYDRRLAQVGKGGSDSVIAELVDELGPEVSESMIREAIKERSPKSG